MCFMRQKDWQNNSEPIGLMEPMLPTEGSSHILNKLVVDIVTKSNALDAISQKETPIDWIKAKLSLMGEIDQTLRRIWDKFGVNSEEDEKFSNLHRRGFDSIDERMTSELKEILNAPEVQAEGGWIAAATFGKEASEWAWLIVQHADHDVGFQIQMLSLLEELYAQDNSVAALQNIAYLHDRIHVSQNKPQRYGTQGCRNADGIWHPAPCESISIDVIDELRRRMGVGWTLVDYFNFMNRHIPDNNLHKKILLTVDSEDIIFLSHEMK